MEKEAANWSTEIEARRSEASRLDADLEALRAERESIEQELGPLRELLDFDDPDRQHYVDEQREALTREREALQRAADDRQRLVCEVLPRALLHVAVARAAESPGTEEEADPRWRKGANRALKDIARVISRGGLSWLNDPPRADQVEEELRQEIKLPSEIELRRAEQRRKIKEEVREACEAARRELPGMLRWREGAEREKRCREIEHEIAALGATPRGATAADVNHLVDLEAHQRKIDTNIEQAAQKRRKLDEDGLAIDDPGAEDYEASTQRLRDRMQSFSLRAAKAASVVKALVALADEMLARRSNQFGVKTTDQLGAIAHKRDVLHHVKIEPPTYRYVVYDKYGKPAPLERSAGERNLLGLCFANAARSVAGRHLPAIIEAPLRVLDPVHREAVISHLLARATGQLILLVLPGEIPEPLSPELQCRIAHRLLIAKDTEGGLESRRIIEEFPRA